MIATERLVLRRWRAEDLAAFAAMSADAEVMRYFPAVLDRAGAAASVARHQDRWTQDGFGFGAIERRSDGAFLGLAGLARITRPGGLQGAVQLGWRLAREHWGKGYATEAARGWIGHGFEVLGLEEVIAFAASGNARSIAVMRRLGMAADPARDFDHPALPAGHPLRAHRVFVLRRSGA